ncbi:VOC family protein [Mycobacterium sp. ITM-2016-00317]|uniref:VOC family protein n=1 Tax=Mycobacterium sp. ITM-2016-00317 TaxID=2099694 RepID=UPI00287F709A|nr:VOC family protein [Mycobacterium sp. ITM-2016-00317]WNG88667.1 VOC family protein [Mycobacterium sp. ITM-2016-00317]
MNGHDPLDVLRGGDLPVAPDRAFAQRLRARLEAAADLFEQQPDRTQGVTMSGTDTAIAELARPAPVVHGAAVPYLTVADARAAIDWYIDVFGAALAGDPIEMDDGRIGHAELTLAGGVLYLADEYPEIGLKAPAPQAVSVSLMVTVADTDAALQRARDGGAHIQREPYENYGARNAALVDPFGHRWMLTGPVTGAVVPIQHGDVGFVSVWTPDAQLAAAFYGRVLGWQVDAATQTVTNVGQRIGLASADRQTLFCCYAVTDLDGARESIVSGGGSVGAVERLGFGDVLRATDSQGTEFGVYVPNQAEPRPLLNGGGHGELSYLTYQVPDSQEFKAFYSRVLFWTFSPGRVADGWEIEGTRPMSGAAGGSTSAVTVPMWTVDDIDAAVARVREAGGTVIDEPSQQSYGKSALCADDQGTRFYLGEL